MVDIASRVYNHKWKIDPIVRSLIDNLAFALFVDRARRLLTSPSALRRTNITAGCLLIGVGLVIPLA